MPDLFSFSIFPAVSSVANGIISPKMLNIKAFMVLVSYFYLFISPHFFNQSSGISNFNPTISLRRKGLQLLTMMLLFSFFYSFWFIFYPHFAIICTLTFLCPPSHSICSIWFSKAQDSLDTREWRKQRKAIEATIPQC